ncbi:MAG: hypothetical protein M1834_003803 [Cirrosporium novae-zelandiae]|nr:MAG: hypothetical protein M1834_003803 [Cirrosporium novae-zelandiae]
MPPRTSPLLTTLTKCKPVQLQCRWNSTDNPASSAGALANTLSRTELASNISPDIRDQFTRLDKARTTYRDQQKSAAALEANLVKTRARALQRFQPRKWKGGDVYAPHDLGPIEALKWRQRKRVAVDVFDALGINPLNEYKNFAMMGEYMTELGRIKHSSETGLRNVNQRKIAKAIRRAVGIGLMPSVHRHPEMIAESLRRE